jgi:hypothetical protein
VRDVQRSRDFTVLWLAQTTNELGSQVGAFAFPLVTVAVTGSPLLAGLVGAAFLLGEVVALLPGGVLADRVDRRLLLRLTSGTDALLHAGLGVLALLGSPGAVHLGVVALLSGARAGLAGPAEMSAVRSVVDREDLPTALSLQQARVHTATLLGGPLAALLYGVARWAPFVADAVASAVAWLLLGRLRADLSAPARPAGAPRRGALADVREGARFVWQVPLLRTVTGWAALTNLSMNCLFTVAVLRLVTEGTDPLHVGLVDAAAGGAGILGAALAPWVIHRVPTGWLTIAVAWSPLPLVVPMALWGNPVVVAAALGCVLLVNPAGNAGMSAYRMTITPEALVGRVQAASRVLAMLPMPLAPVLAGALLTGLGGGAALLACGAVCGLVALVPTLSRHVRAVPRPGSWAPAVQPATQPVTPPVTQPVA